MVVEKPYVAPRSSVAANDPVKPGLHSYDTGRTPDRAGHFIQYRRGRGGAQIPMVKLRTMADKPFGDVDNPYQEFGITWDLRPDVAPILLPGMDEVRDKKQDEWGKFRNLFRGELHLYGLGFITDETWEQLPPDLQEFYDHDGPSLVPVHSTIKRVDANYTFERMRDFAEKVTQNPRLRWMYEIEGLGNKVWRDLWLGEERPEGNGEVRFVEDVVMEEPFNLWAQHFQGSG